MPVYEYQCKACNREFEYQQRMSDPEKLTCEACGEDKLERLISRTAFQLKGSGWYKDLYSSAKPAESSGDGGTKSDSASADKPATPAATPAPASSTPAATPSSSTPSSSGSSSGSSGSSGSGSSGSSGGSSGSGGTGKSAARKMPAA
ncbi:MAG: zinc ribbon domain-containing protein [Kofleriaceae bacterium]